jgi:hypothetical protein
VPAQTAAATEAYLLTKEAAFADFAFEMSDWLCGLQYDQAVDLRRATWVGGFRGWADGKPQDVAPTIASAAYAEALADGCRVARQKVDLPRYRRYGEATGAVCSTSRPCSSTSRTRSTSRAGIARSWWAASTRRTTDRIDYTQHAVSAMVQYFAEQWAVSSVQRRPAFFAAHCPLSTVHCQGYSTSSFRRPHQRGGGGGSPARRHSSAATARSPP